MRSPNGLSRRSFVRRMAGVTVSSPLAASLAGVPPRSGETDYLFEEGLVYFNTGALGPTPRRVVEEAARVWSDLEANPSFHAYFRLEEAMEDVRVSASRVMGGGDGEVMVTNSTTDAMNIVAQGSALQSGQRVLTTDQEHPGGLLGWQHYARRMGVAIDVVSIAPGERDIGAIVDRFAQAIRPETMVISVSHVLWTTGMRMPVAELSRLARERGCVSVVDGAQALGAIAVDVKEIGCDAYAAAGHKWLMGPKGTGLLYLRDDPAKRIDPLVLEDGREAQTESTGVRNIPGILGLGTALALFESRGVDTVASRALALRNHLYERVRTVPGITVASPEPGPLASPLLTFQVPRGVDNGALVTRLREAYRIIVKPIRTPQLNAVRASTHIFNTEEEIDSLVRALRAELE